MLMYCTRRLPYLPLYREQSTEETNYSCPEAIMLEVWTRLIFGKSVFVYNKAATEV